MRIAVINCKKMKQTYPCSVREMYFKSPLFRSQLEFCELVGYDKIYIFSIKYGLVGLDDIIEPYDLTLSNTLVVNANLVDNNSANQVATKVYNQLNNENNEVHFHMSAIYFNLIRKHLTIPHRRLVQGKQATQTMMSYNAAIKKYKETNDLEEAIKVLEYKKPQRKLNEPNRMWYHPDGRTFYGGHIHLATAHPEVNLGTSYKVMMTYIGELIGENWTYHCKGWHLDTTLKFHQVNQKWRIKT